MRLDPSVVRQQIENLKITCPDTWEDGDEKLLTDVLAGETDLMEFLMIVEDQRQEATSMAAGIATRIAELGIRQERYERREKARRDLMFKLMSAADLRKAELPIATLSIRTGQRKLVGDADPLFVPEQFRRVKVDLDRVAIKKAIEEGATVIGFELSNGEPSISIRTK